MKPNILHIIDFAKVGTLLEGFNKSTGFVTAILDLNGNVLSKSGWRQMCTEFHRINPETSKKCTISDTELANKMGEGEKYHFYKCLNGLVDVAVPIIINGEHVANLFSGQFFFEEPDSSFFKKQAEKYGFDEGKYLEALKNVPVVSREKVKTAMDFLLNMTQMISEITLQKLEQTELNKTIIESEEKFKAVFESANVGKSITLPTGEINVNQAFCDMLGYTREELQNKKWQDLTPEDEIPAIQASTNPLLAGEKDSARFEKKYICKNGTFIWADVSISIRRDDNGKPLHFITTVIDITERKQVEEEVKRAALLLQSSIESPKDMIILSIDKNYNYLYFNDCHKAAMVFAYGKDVKIGMNLLDCITNEEDKIKAKINYDKALNGESHIAIQEYGDIEKSYYETRYNPVFNHKNEIIGTTAFSADITNRKQAEEKIQKQNVYIKMILDNFPIGIATNEIDSMKVTYMNRKFSEIYGWPEDDFPYVENFFEKIFPDLEYRQQLQSRILADISSGDSDRMNWDNLKITTKAGDQRIVYAHNIPLLSQNMMVSTVQDITERKNAEESLKISRERLLLATEGANLGIWNWNTVTGELIWSNQCKVLFGIGLNETMSYQRFIDALHPDDRERTDLAVKHALDNHKDFDIDYRCLWPDGSIHWLAAKGRGYYDAMGKTVRMEGILLDITQRKHDEEEIKKQLDELQRWQAVIIGRESRVSEIKREVNELLIRLGEPIRYPSQENSKDKNDTR